MGTRSLKYRKSYLAMGRRYGGRLVAVCVGRVGRRLVSVFSCILAVVIPGVAQELPGELQNKGVEWLQQYIQLDTVNPPGNEIVGAEFFARIFQAEGIPYEIVESAPGRGNIWARLEGGDQPGLVLLHHMDVVPADPDYWQVDPLSGLIEDGFIYGRGTLDTKSLGIVQLAAFLWLHRSDVPLNRDVIFMATADEEAGGEWGVGWLVEQRSEIFEGVGYAINEGGGGTSIDGQVRFSVEITQKIPYWLRLTTRGQPGHGSRPQVESAVTRLVSALDRLRAHVFPIRVVPAVDVYFSALSTTAGSRWSRRYEDIETALLDPDVAAELRRDNPSHYGLISNTCSMTRLGGSDKINVIPTEAWAELDCRLLPDQDPDEFLEDLGRVLGDEVQVMVLMGFTPAQSSAETGLFRTIETVTRSYFPEASVIPSVLTAFTDSHFLRDLGITAYGYDPFVVPRMDQAGVHGNNERLSVENVRRGVVVMSDLLLRWVVD